MKILLRVTLLSVFCLIVGCSTKPDASAPIEPKEKQKMEDLMKKSQKHK